MKKPLHALEFGPRPEEGVLEQLLMSQRDSELVRGICHLVRDAGLGFVGVAVGEVVQKNDHGAHLALGAIDFAETLLNQIQEMRLAQEPNAKPAASEEEAMLG